MPYPAEGAGFTHEKEVAISYAVYYVASDLMPDDEAGFRYRLDLFNDLAKEQNMQEACCAAGAELSCCLNSEYPDPDSLMDEWDAFARNSTSTTVTTVTTVTTTTGATTTTTTETATETLEDHSDHYAGRPQKSAFALGAYVGKKVRRLPRL